MSLFHKLQDVYYDAVDLAEQLERIPAACDCGDADAHISGSCCCAGAQPHRTSEESEPRTGCLARVNELSESIQWFREDVRRDRGEVSRVEISGALEGRLSLIDNLIDDLSSMLTRLKLDLAEFRANCAYPALERMKKSNDDLRRYTAELNELL